MAIRSNNDPRFTRRFLLMGLAAVGFALWSLYDGAIGYPHQRERALAHEKLHEEQEGGDPVVFRDKWHAYANERGWSTAYPGEPKSEADIMMQYVMAAIAGTIGLLLISVPIRSRGTWIEANETGITSSWGQSLRFDQVESLDKRKWRSKGIAKVTYQDGNRRRRFVLDDYKFDRYSTDAILYELEQRIGPEKITGGPPEPASDVHGGDSADLAAANQDYSG